MLKAFEPAWVVETFRAAAHLAVDALQAVEHHLSDGEIDRARAFATSIIESATRFGPPAFT
jgi:hypothetical protein